MTIGFVGCGLVGLPRCVAIVGGRCGDTIVKHSLFGVTFQ